MSVYPHYAGEFDDLAREFNEQWGTLTPISWPNIVYSPPTDKSWVRFNILNTESKRMSFGAPGLNRASYPGRVVIQCFVPRGKGEVLARQYADRAIVIFKNLRISNYRMGLPYVEQASSSIDAGLWHQVNMNCSFVRDVYHG